MDTTSSEAESQEEMLHCLGDAFQVIIPPGVASPRKGSKESAGWDCKENQSVTLHPCHAKKVDLGLQLAMPPGHSMLLCSWSQLAAEGITTQGGVIYSDCIGPVQCMPPKLPAESPKEKGSVKPSSYACQK